MFRRRSSQQGPPAEPARVEPRAQITDYLGVPGPIMVQGVPHELRESGFTQLGWLPQVERVMTQTYLPPGQEFDSSTWQFSIRMVALTPPWEVMMARARSLEARHEIDPIVNYQAVWDEGREDDICLDYLVSHPSGTAFEWTAERLVPWRQHLTACYLVVRRGYGEGARAFLEGLSVDRPAAIAALRGMELPQVTDTTLGQA